MAKSNKKVMITNGKGEHVRISENDPIPEGWVKPTNKSPWHIITNGEMSVRVSKDDPIPEGWETGMAVRVWKQGISLIVDAATGKPKNG